jgi:serine/threonine protein kinase
MFPSRYKVVERLGEGGQAQVFLALDLARDGREVALKVLRPGAERGEGDLRREFEALSTLRHPNLVSVLDFGTGEDGALYFTSEYFAGKALRACMVELSADERLDVLCQILRGLEYVHTRGVVHYDLKPENVLVRRAGGYEVKITDFGLAGPAEGTPRARGTAHYMAPELARGAATDRRADLYSFGVIFYELLTGAPPYEGESALDVIRKQIEDRPVPPRARGGPVEEARARLVLNLLD